MRVEWWRDDRPTYREAALLPAKDRSGLPDQPVPSSVLPGYAHARPVFIGHYWMSGTQRPLAQNVACVDYSAGRDGPLVAYRWSGEARLDARNFVAARAA